jgi:hypothetical protein
MRTGVLGIKKLPAGHSTPEGVQHTRHLGTDPYGASAKMEASPPRHPFDRTAATQTVLPGSPGASHPPLVSYMSHSRLIVKKTSLALSAPFHI